MWTWHGVPSGARRSRLRPARDLSRHLRVLALVVLVVFIGSAEHLPIKSYTSADGLGIGAVKRIVRDSHGFLWLCTQNGVSRFDGTRFVSHSVESTGIPFGSTNDLLESDGAYWVATNAKGVWRVAASSVSSTLKIRSVPPGRAEPPQFKVYPVGDEPASNRVNVLYRDGAGRLWAGTDAGLFRMDDLHSAGKFHPVPLGLSSHPD